MLDARALAGDALVREVLDPSWPVPAPAASAIDSLTARRDAALAHYDVPGRTVLHDGRLLTADIDAIRHQARDEAQRLWQRMREVTP